jgi:C4-dicarboxylate transporter
VTDPGVHRDEAGEVVDGVPVVASTREIEPVAPAVPARQAAALAATSFVAGAAAVAVVSRRRARTARRRLRRRQVGTLGEIVTSNSFLVDVHLLRRD